MYMKCMIVVICLQTSTLLLYYHIFFDRALCYYPILNGVHQLMMRIVTYEFNNM